MSSPIVKVYFGPEHYQFFYCDSDVIDCDPQIYASTPAIWRANNPNVTPTEAAALTEEMRECEAIPGTH
jgi:hypothetical protein